MDCLKLHISDAGVTLLVVMECKMPRLSRPSRMNQAVCSSERANAKAICKYSTLSMKSMPPACTDLCIESHAERSQSEYSQSCNGGLKTYIKMCFF